MPHFQKRGNRIRASDKSLVFRFSAGSLLLLFLAVVLLLNLKTIAATDWKSVHFLQDGSVHLTVTPYMIVSVIAALLICGAAALLYRRFQYDRVKQLFHRQKLAKMISSEMKEQLLKQTLKKYFFKCVSKFSKIQNFFIKNKKVLANLLP